MIYRHMIRYGHSGIIPLLVNSYRDMIEFHSMRDYEAANTYEEAPNREPIIDEELAILDEGFDVDSVEN